MNIYELKEEICEFMDEIMDYDISQLQEEQLAARYSARKARILFNTEEKLRLRIMLDVIKYFIATKLEIK